MSKAMIFDIIRNSYVDGPGIRTAVFFKGCNLHCAWCHNPESQSMKHQMLIYKDKCIGCGRCEKVCVNETCIYCGKCELYCPADARKICGREYDADEILREVLRDVDYYNTSGGGVTFSGGECMLQVDFLEEILRKCRENGVHTAVDTAGHIPFERFERIMPYTDLFLYDVKCFDSAKHKRYTGVGNELILENLRKLFDVGAKVWIRIPVIPGVNDSRDEMERIKRLIGNRAEKIELLPYHTMGDNKYLALGMELHEFDVPSKEKMAELRSVFEA